MIAAFTTTTIATLLLKVEILENALFTLAITCDARFYRAGV
jgi:hypothetical protein